MSAAAVTGTLLDGRWTVDTRRATALFVARDVLRRPVTGALPVTSAAVDVVGGVPAAVEARLDLAGVDTGHARRDRDLRGPRFFDVERSGELAFSSAGAASPAPGGWRLPGVLVLRGLECALLLHVEVVRAGDDVQVRATATVDRTDLGIRVPRVLVGPSVDLTVTAVLRRPEPQAGA